MTDRSVIENVAHTLMTDLSVMGVHVYRSTGNSPTLSGTLSRVPKQFLKICMQRLGGKHCSGKRVKIGWEYYRDVK